MLRERPIRGNRPRRDAAGLQAAAEQVDFWNRYVLTDEFSNPAGWELQNMLTVAQIMVHAAQLREESRGVHLRTDFPNPDDSLGHHRFALRRLESGQLDFVDGG